MQKVKQRMDTERTSRAGSSGVALMAICLSAIMLGLEISSVPAILPTLEHVLPASFQQIQWVMNAYTLAMTSSLMACGALADRFGRKRVFMIGIVLFGLSSLACGMAQSATALIAARYLQGASGAAMLTCQIAALSQQFAQGEKRRVAFAWWGVSFGAGLGFGPLVGAVTAAVAGWPWVFLLHALLALVALGLARRGLVESSNPNTPPVDVPGMVTLSLSIFLFVYLIIHGQPVDGAHPESLVLAAIAVLSLLAFVWIERRRQHPLFDFQVFRIRAFSGALAGSAGMNVSFWPFVMYLPIYFQAVLSMNALMASVMLLAYTIPPLVMPPLAERLLDRLGARVVIPLGLFTIGVGFVSMWMAAQYWASSALALIPGCIVAGIGLGLTNTTVSNTSTSVIAPERVGMASGMDTSTRILSLAIHIALLGRILLHGISTELNRLGCDVASGSCGAWVGDLVAGNFAVLSPALAQSAVAHTAILNGFRDVMGYAAAAVWALALVSFLLFGKTAPKSDLARLCEGPRGPAASG